MSVNGTFVDHPSPDLETVLSPVADHAVSELVCLLIDGLPDNATPDDLSWVAHPNAGRLFLWAAEVAGPDAALPAARYVLGRAAEIRRDETTPEVVVARVRRYATRWATEVCPTARRHEVPVEEFWSPAPDIDRPAADTPDPLAELPTWLSAAVGLPFTETARKRLIICATVAVDLAADDDRQVVAGAAPLGGVFRRRLADHLDPPLACPIARRSAARLLLGPTGKPEDGVLSRFAHGQRPIQAPVSVRAGWAADVADLDPTLLGDRSRPLAREAIRRMVVQSVVTPIDLHALRSENSPALV